MTLSLRMAVESPLVTTDVINIAVLPYLAIRHGVEDVPTVVANGRRAVVGILGEDEFVDRVLAAAVPIPAQ